MDSLGLDDFVYSYPSVYDPDLQAKISGKYEFFELKSTEVEKTPERGEFFKHQVAVHRYMSHYDRLLAFHPAGTGKTGVAMGLAESIKNNTKRISNAIDKYYSQFDNNIRHVYVIVKGQLLKQELTNQLVCKYSVPGTYDDEEVLSSRKSETRKKRINKNLRKFYTFDTYDSFAKEELYDKETKTIIWDRQTREKIRRKYNNCLIIVDEVHNVKTNIEEETAIDEFGQKNIVREKKRGLIYDKLHKIFHEINHSKIVLMSATPMINFPKEISEIMNLILPLDDQMKLEYLDDLDLHRDRLVELFNGRLSYAGQYRTDKIKITYMGDSVPNPDLPVDSQIKIYKSYLTGVQLETYRDIETNPGAFDTRIRQASVFVYPDGSFGLAGYKKYVNTKNENNRQELIEWVSDRNKLIELSTKFDTILNLLEEIPGNHFIYSDWKDPGVGILGFVLNRYGYEEYNPSGKTNTIVTSDYCGRERSKILKPLSERLRYAIIEGESSDPKRSGKNRNQEILRVFNSRENRHGELIKVLLASPVGREGINTANVLAVHLVGASWNQSNSYQAIQRSIRATSHDDLLAEGGEVEIFIFQHAAVDKDNDKSIDIKNYHLSETKDYKIKQIERIMKETSFDCQINKFRNDVYGYRENSAECGYSNCTSQCVNQMPEIFDFSSWMLLYSDDVVTDLSELLIEFFEHTRKTRAYFEQIYFYFHQVLLDLPSYTDLLNDISEKDLIWLYDMGINKTLNDRKTVRDRFGRIFFLATNGISIFTIKKYPIDPLNVDLSENENSTVLNYRFDMNLTKIKVEVSGDRYSEIGQEIIDKFSEMIEKIKQIEEERNKNLVDLVGLVNPNYMYENYRDLTSQYENFLTSIPIELQIESFEKSYLKQYDDELLNDCIFEFYANIHKYFISQLDNVKYHIIKSMKTRTKKGGASKQLQYGGENLFRIFDNDKWRDPTREEIDLLKEDIKVQVKEYMKDLGFENKKNPAYMVYINSDGRKLIKRNKNFPRDYLKTKAIVGIKCQSMSEFDLYDLIYDILKYLSLYPDTDHTDTIVVKTQEALELINELKDEDLDNRLSIIKVPDNIIKKLELDRKRHIIAWNQLGYNKNTLCEIINEHFENYGLVLSL